MQLFLIVFAALAAKPNSQDSYTGPSSYEAPLTAVGRNYKIETSEISGLLPPSEIPLNKDAHVRFQLILYKYWDVKC